MKPLNSPYGDLLQLPTTTLLSYAAAWVTLLSIVTFLVYATDKGLAKAGSRRISERTLLLLGFLGGTLGAIAAMILVRHKCSKLQFQQKFWAVTALQAAAVIGGVVFVNSQRKLLPGKNDIYVLGVRSGNRNPADTPVAPPAASKPRSSPHPTKAMVW